MPPHVLGRAIKYAEIYELRLSAHPRHVVCDFLRMKLPMHFHAPTRPGDGDNEVGKYLFPEIATRRFDKRRAWGRSSLISTLDGWWREKGSLLSSAECGTQHCTTSCSQGSGDVAKFISFFFVAKLTSHHVRIAFGTHTTVQLHFYYNLWLRSTFSSLLLRAAHHPPLISTITKV